ncbi:non-ribosomal peptide synthetase [Tumebacillus permanentifrigoris]|uniref:Amino acid adenylation domain-containing protein/thioester reductase-like protein n=1 Tax=Tumebacillus permanentifrigoris TaxID=378543 RepID=A0A316DCI5_9BACL|nr:non-ribosomal peptide synthetase [Tumebacillus permanentifrigoris]PWK14997.1 amino acid adenylation domain-containing protein/thioester reductase-like protein [Tumebacillus permanentifrigoris]
MSPKTEKLNAQHLEFWKRVFEDEVSVTAIPSDWSRSTKGGTKAVLQRVLPAEVTEKIYGMAQRSNLGVYMILLSGVNYVLARYTGSSDLVVGAPVTMQSESDADEQNLLLLRSQLNPELTFREWMGVIKNTVTEAFRHQTTSFQLIAENYKLIHHDAELPQVDTLVLFKPIQSESSKERVLSNSVFSFDYVDGQLILHLEYEQDLFHQETMEYFMDGITAYYEAVFRDPSAKLADLDLLSEQSRQAILHNFNKPYEAHQYAGQTVEQIIAQRVLAQPDEVALIFEDQKLTYRELNDQADAVAHQLLHEHHVKPDEAVAVYMQRSAFIYVAILGILKAGAAYVPIDPIFPEERVKTIFEEASIRAAVTLPTQAPVLDELLSSCADFQAYICLNTENAAAQANASASDVSVPVFENDERLAYIIFTSGSTGKPKGVELEQRTVVEFIQGIHQIVEPVAPKVVLNATSISFDIFVVESWYALSQGMQIVIANEREHMDPVEIARLITEHQIELLQLTPSRLQLLLNHPTGREALSKVKMIMVGGEELKLKQLKELQVLTTAAIVNVYGPTEATVWATAAVLNDSTYVKIGAPLRNYTCYILDEQDRLQMIGGIGELVIGGAGLARGYLNNPELTDEKFITSPIDGKERLYRTGDHARWLPNGEIQCLGRRDNQVKVSGYRIELGEIEAALTSHPEISEAAVIVKTDEHGNKSIAGYLVSDLDWTHSELYEFLKLKLPEYMIPAQFIKVSKLPLTVSGKIDGIALQRMVQQVVAGTAYRAPENDVQRALADAWQQILGKESVGIDDNFFQIGGTSLSGIQLVALLGDRYTLSINDIFAYPTIAELSVQLQESVGYFQQFMDMFNQPAPTAEELAEVRATDERLLAEYRERFSAYQGLDLEARKSYQHIFLTGGAGYLGTHLLQELLANTAAQITVLVRAQTHQAAHQLLTERTEYYFEAQSKELDWSRVHVVAGDLTKPHLGLSADEYDQLARETDCVIHAAALIKHYGLEADFKKNNVEATQAALDFAKAQQRKDFHHVSTASIGTGTDIKVFHEFIENVDGTIDHHYLRSKGEAEKLVRKEQADGLNCTIYRLNSLSQNTRTGKFMLDIESNGFHTFVQGLNQLGLYPDLNDQVLDLTGVDQAAEAIVRLFDRPALHNQNHHIFNPNRVSWAKFGQVIKSEQPRVELVPFEAFIQTVREKFDDSAQRNDILSVVMNLFMLRNTEMLGYKRVCEKTEVLLKQLDFAWSPIEDSQIQCYL